MNAINKIAVCARPICAAGSFHCNFLSRYEQAKKAAPKRRATIRVGASHTTKQAGNLPDSEVFSRSEFDDVLTFQRIYGFGAGSAYPQGRQHNLFCVTTPSSTLCPSQANGGLQFIKERETMTNVNIPTTSKLDTNARQQAIESALESALYFIRTDHPGYSLCLAMARTRRALSMLKQACAEAKNGGAA